MLRSRTIAGIALLIACVATGCAAPGKPLAVDSVSVDVESDPRPPAAADDVAAKVAEAAATGAPAKSPPAAEAAFGEIISELESLGSIEPGERSRLIADLSRTDPALWPQLIQYFKASVEHQRGRHAASPSEAVASVREPRSRPLAPPDGVRSDASPASPVIADTQNPAAGELFTPPSAPVEPAQTGQSTPPAVVIATDNHIDPNDGRPDVVQVGYQAPMSSSDPVDWRQSLAGAIQELESELAASPATATDDPRSAQLRLLYLAAGRRDDLLRASSAANAPDSGFWAQEAFGLATYLDSQRVPDAGRRATEAARHLSDAAVTLAEQGTLIVRNLAFCTRVDSFGVYTPFEKREFKPGEEVLLYAEVENFRSEPSPQGFRTALASRVQVFDARGGRIDEQEFPITEERCQNRRRDYFIRYFVRLPERAYDGQHTLQLTIEDTLGRKIGQSSIDFLIKAK